jgi:uncharacterized RDD family membrane protein YckC
MQIYISREGERTGPYSVEEVNRQLAAGILDPSDLGWSEASPGWKPLVSFAGVIMPGGASSTAIPIAIATPITHGLPRFAGFWIRAAAFLVDCLILAIPVWVIQIVVGRAADDQTAGHPITAMFFIIVIELFYFAGLWASPMQATLGQKLCGLKVVDAITRRKISFWRGAARLLALWLGIAIFLIGVIMVAFTERKRGLHDMVAGTYVVKERKDWL